MQCLIPFIIMTLVNVLFDFIQRMAFLRVMPYGICLAGSIISQAFAVYFACCIYKRIRVPPGEMEMGGFGSGDYNYDRANTGDAPSSTRTKARRQLGRDLFKFPCSGQAALRFFFLKEASTPVLDVCCLMSCCLWCFAFLVLITAEIQLYSDLIRAFLQQAKITLTVKDGSLILSLYCIPFSKLAQEKLVSRSSQLGNFLQRQILWSICANGMATMDPPI